MSRAEVTWNGVAKSYRVGTEVFHQNRSRTEDWPEEMVKYLEATKGFSVVRKDDAPAPKAAAKTEAAPAEEKPAATEEPKDDEGVTTSAKPSSSRRSSRRSRSSD